MSSFSSKTKYHHHASIAPDTHRRLSPAYDLTPAPQSSQDRRDRAMICGDQGRFANEHTFTARSFLLERDEAQKIIAEMMEQISSTWYETVRGCGVSIQEADTIRPAFVYPGFTPARPPAQSALVPTSWQFANASAPLLLS